MFVSFSISERKLTNLCRLGLLTDCLCQEDRSGSLVSLIDYYFPTFRQTCVCSLAQKHTIVTRPLAFWVTKSFEQYCSNSDCQSFQADACIQSAFYGNSLDIQLNALNKLAEYFLNKYFPVYFDGSVLHLFISCYCSVGIKQMPNYQSTSCAHFLIF